MLVHTNTSGICGYLASYACVPRLMGRKTMDKKLWIKKIG